jgi:hypothetical protein
MLMEVPSAYQGTAAWAFCNHAALRQPILALTMLGQDEDQDVADATGIGEVWGNVVGVKPKVGQDVGGVHWHATGVLEVGGLGHVAVGDAHWSGPLGSRLVAAAAVVSGVAWRMIHGRVLHHVNLNHNPLHGKLGRRRLACGLSGWYESIGKADEGEGDNEGQGVDGLKAAVTGDGGGGLGGRLASGLGHERYS